ncbi:MAG: hypothetical protein NZ951_08385 [Dehalococcoidia bacterium]|nr:hypothetical protein [Dehalococcoidia bacterium]MDW8120462.1 hypothetical protein [Chloroflexota bacterium]
MAALETEVRKVLEATPRREQWQEGNVQIYRSPERGWIMALCGVGREGVDRTIEALARHRPQGVIATGFVAGLEEGLRPGLLVAPEQVCLLEEWVGTARIGPIVEVDSEWLAFCQRALGPALRLVHGAVTVGRILVSPRQKRLLAHSTHASIADLESYWVGVACRARGIPFVVVRVVMDSLHHALPPFLEGYRGSSMERAALGWALWHPWWWPRLWGLRRAALQAQNALGKGLVALTHAWEAQREAA